MLGIRLNLPNRSFITGVSWKQCIWICILLYMQSNIRWVFFVFFDIIYLLNISHNDIYYVWSTCNCLSNCACLLLIMHFVHSIEWSSLSFCTYLYVKSLWSHLEGARTYLFFRDPSSSTGSLTPQRGLCISSWVRMSRTPVGVIPPILCSFFMASEMSTAIRLCAPCSTWRCDIYPNSAKYFWKIQKLHSEKLNWYM